jgi:hypothetical protein
MKPLHPLGTDKMRGQNAVTYLLSMDSENIKEVCKTFIHRFDSGPRLQLQPPIKSGDLGSSQRCCFGLRSVGQNRRRPTEDTQARRTSGLGQSLGQNCGPHYLACALLILTASPLLASVPEVVASWRTATLNVHLDLPERYQGTARAAFAYWQDTTAMRFHFVRTDGPNTISVRYSPSWCGQPDSMQAHAHWPPYPRVGEPLPIFDDRLRHMHGDIHLNAVHRPLFEAYPDAVFFVLLHEIGHSLGVPHLNCGPDDRALMCPAWWPVFTHDDMAPVWAEYGYPGGRTARQEASRAH